MIIKNEVEVTGVNKFYKFLEEKKKEKRYYCDIDYLMLDYYDGKSN